MDHFSSRSSRSPKNTRGTDRISFSCSRFVSSLSGCFSEYESHNPDGRNRLLPEELAIFSKDYLLNNLFSKFDDGKSNQERRVAALDRFSLAEAGCSLMNQKFSTYKNGHYGPYTQEINLGRTLILRLLGREVNLNQIAKSFDFGPGASTRLRRTKGDRAFKFSGQPDVTARCLPYARAAWQTGLGSTLNYVPLFNVVRGSKLETVPKNIKTDRVIAIEPDMNMYIQKGFGTYIRDRLRTVGIDLNKQEANQNGAFSAYDDQLATIDLSMASDTISDGIVRTLLPEDWYNHLDSIRSHGYVSEREWYPFQKFSSMGNGFTFELESLIFWALCEAVNRLYGTKEHRVLVYGDDIIVHSEIAPKVISLLSFCGFTTNEDKTFTSGPFFESCGKHFYKNHDVTPFFIRRPVDNIDELMLVHNNLRRWISRNWRVLSDDCINRLEKLASSLKFLAPARYRKLLIPDGFGDGGFIANVPDILLLSPQNRKILKRGGDTRAWHEGYILRHNTPSTKPVITDVEGLLPKAFGRIGQKVSSESDILPVRQLPGIRTLRWLVVPYTFTDDFFNCKDRVYYLTNDNS